MKKNNHPILYKLIQMRKEKSKTHKEVAKYAGVCPSMYYYLENGQKKLSYDVAAKLADFYEMTPDELFFEDFKQFYDSANI